MKKLFQGGIITAMLLLQFIAIAQTIPPDATQLENIQITNNGNSQTALKIVVQEENGVLNTVSFPQNNRFTSLGSISITDGLFEASTGFSWIIGNSEHANSTVYQVEIDPAGTGNSRTDVIVTNGNTFIKIEGTVSSGEGTSAKPPIPVGVLELTTIQIYEDNFLSLSNPVLGNTYVSKASRGINFYNGSGAAVKPFFDYSEGKRGYVLTNSSLVSIAGLSFSTGINQPITGDVYKFIIDNTNGVTFLANQVSTNLSPFVMESNLEAKDGSVVSFVFDGISLVFDNYSLTIDNEENEFISDPLFIMQSLATKLNGSPALPKIIPILSRDNDRQFSVSPSEISDFEETQKSFGIVMFVGGEYKVFSAYCDDKTTGVIRTGEVLPTTLTDFMTLQDGYLGQHLSRYGYRALAEYLANQIEGNAYRKRIIKQLISQKLTPYEQNAIDESTGELIATFVKTDGTPSGGVLIPGELNNTFEVQPNASAMSGERIFYRGYGISQGTEGYGGYFVWNDFKPFNGYARIVLGEQLKYNQGALRVIVSDQYGTIYFERIRGANQEIIIPITSKSKELLFSFTCDESVVTAFQISVVELVEQLRDKPLPIFNKKTNIAFLCDSWGEFPLTVSGDTPVERADGSISNGQMYLSKHLQEYLINKGYNVSTFNNSRGGQTSEWARYWIKQLILDLPVKPDYCVINFAINDYNSFSVYANEDSVFDFSPTDPYTSLVVSEGGIKGSVTQEKWLENIKYLIKTLQENNIQPVLMTAPFTASYNPFLLDLQVPVFDKSFEEGFIPISGYSKVYGVKDFDESPQVPNGVSEKDAANMNNISNKANVDLQNITPGVRANVISENVANIADMQVIGYDGTMPVISSNLQNVIGQHNNGAMYKFDAVALRLFTGLNTSITIIEDTTVALNVVNLRAYYGLTGASVLASLPNVAGNEGKYITTANKSGVAGGIFSNDSVSNDIWNGDVATNTVILGTKDVLTFFNDGVHWVLTSTN